MPFPTFKTQDEIPEAFRGEYEEKDGQWVAKAAPAPDKPLGEKGESALAAAKQKARDAETARKAAEARVKELEAEAEAAASGVTREALDKINKQAEDKYKKDLEERDQLKVENRTLRLDDKLEKKFIEHGGIAKRWAKAKKDLKDRADLDDKGEIIFKDEDGEVTSDSIDDFFGKTYPAEAPFYYSGTAGSGTGAEESVTGDGNQSSAEVFRAQGKAQGQAERKKNLEANDLALR